MSALLQDTDPISRPERPSGRGLDRLVRLALLLVLSLIGLGLAAVALTVALVAGGSMESDSQATAGTESSEPAQIAPVASPTVNEVAEDMRAAANAGDVAAVAALAPTTSEDIRDFFIGGGPYPKVECQVFEGRDECRLVNGIADFVLVVDGGTVTDIVYVGGE